GEDRLALWTIWTALVGTTTRNAIAITMTKKMMAAAMVAISMTFMEGIPGLAPHPAIYWVYKFYGIARGRCCLQLKQATTACHIFTEPVGPAARAGCCLCLQENGAVRWPAFPAWCGASAILVRNTAFRDNTGWRSRQD